MEMTIETVGLTIAYILCIFTSQVLVFILTNKVFKTNRSKQMVFFCILIWTSVMALGIRYLNNIPLLYITSFVGGILLFSYIFKFVMFQSYLCSCFILFHLIAAKGITIGVMSIVLGENSFMVLENETTEMLSIIISQILTIVMMFIYIKLVNVKEARTFLLNKKQLTNTLICHLTITLFMLFNSFTFYYNLDLIWISVAQILVGVILYFVYIIILHYGIKTADLIQHKLRDQYQLDTIQTQMRQQNSLLRMTEIINVFKHDYREHMLTIEDHIENKRYKEALQEVKKDYLYHLSQLPQTTKFSNNIILNSLLIDRKGLCDSLHIPMEGLLFYPRDLSISEKEYHEVIHILSDNAIEANEKVEKERRYISIKSHVDDQWLSIMIENPYEGIVLFENNLPVSSLDYDGNGMGLIYVEELIEERQGVLRFDTDNNIFKVTLLIRIETDGKSGDI